MPTDQRNLVHHTPSVRESPIRCGCSLGSDDRRALRRPQGMEAILDDLAVPHAELRPSRVPSGEVRVSVDAIARRVLAGGPRGSMPLRVLAIDGHGGAGKTTLAERIAAALGGAPIVHTDDFASWEEPLEWWPRLIEQVLRPLAEGKVARYQRYDWTRQRLGEWVDIPMSSDVVVEGVSSSRLAFRPFLSFAIWVETPRDICLARGLERDGEGMRTQWERWIAHEDQYVGSEEPDRGADLVVSGAATVGGDHDQDVIVIRGWLDT